jgi:hypothetical protein
MGEEMGSSHQRLLAAATLVLAMSAIVGLVVLSPLVWRDGPSPGPAPEALPAQGEVAEVVAPNPAPPAAQPKQPAVAQPVTPARAASEGSTAVAARSGQPQSLERSRKATPPPPPPPPAVDDKKGKAKGHEKKGLGSKKAGKHGHHAQGAPGKGNGKGKSKDRDRAPARARG